MQSVGKSLRSAHGKVPVVPWQDLHVEAKKRFGIEHFRPGQREVLEAVFSGQNALALMPTGAGKSLCYQLPALFLQKTVMVVSPLIALMKDQQEKAEDAEIAAEKLDSTLTPRESSAVEDAIEAGIPQLLYVTPERLENAEFVSMMADRGVSLMAVDEAHCISQWGHDFRPAYLNLGEARHKLGNPPVLALTATASETVVSDILKQLHAQDSVVVNTGIERDNLLFSVRHTVNTVAKQRLLMDLIAEEHGTGIVYTASIRTANEIYEWLLSNGVSAGRYHGRLKVKEREEMQAAFMRDQYKVLVATKAFGMGIDKPDVRFVYHYEFPDSLETYYQEAGRAGRDGEAARAVLLYRLEDKRIQSFFLSGRYPHLNEVQRVYTAISAEATLAEAAASAALSSRRTQVILHMLLQAGLAVRRRDRFEPSGVSGSQQLEEILAAYKARAATDTSRLTEMMHYAESPRCRKQLLRLYFAEDEGKPCGTCDNCSSDTDRLDVQTGDMTQPEVTRIETLAGVIMTTAPETLPQAEDNSLSKGDVIQHRRFGRGKVLDSDGQNIIARFEKAGTKKVRVTFVRRAG